MLFLSKFFQKTTKIAFTFYLLATFSNAFCPPGCECNDELLTVFCDFSGINAVPILLNPMLKSLTIKNSNGLKLDTFSIALYQELEHLDISDSQINLIPPGFISQMSKLKYLSLRGNRLKLIDDQMFGNGQNIRGKSKQTLEHLDLSNNQIERISPNSFQLLSSLLTLNISFNQLHFLSEKTFLGLNKLKILDLTRNRISKLEKIKIKKEGINFEKSLFEGIEHLEELKLTGNLLAELPSNLFHSLPSLIKLDLSSNLISYISSDAFNGLKELRELRLEKNLLSSFVSESNNNKIPTETEIKNLFPQKLEFLDLSGNSWMKIPPLNISTLKILKIEEMVQLREIQENSFTLLPNLESLSLANSIFLSKIDQKAFGNFLENKLETNIKYLDLSNCQLSNLSVLLLDWKKIKMLKLEGNRWNCDCQLISFLPQILQKIKSTGDNFVEKVLCKEPNEYINIPLIEFNYKQKMNECENIKIISSPFLENEKEENIKIFKNNFITTIISGLSLLMFTSIILLLYCFCCTTKVNNSRRTSIISDNNDCCCCYSQKNQKINNKQNQHNNSLLFPKLIIGTQQQQQPYLYSTGSTYIESLIYEKGKEKGIKSLHCPFYGCANCPKVLLNSTDYQKRESLLNLKVSNEHQLNNGNENENSSSCSSSTGEDYYSSIVQLDNFEENNETQKFHLNPQNHHHLPLHQILLLLYQNSQQQHLLIN
uniref:Uncharacterized protein n=1 Tax=Meloidogyne enterolobii TaxID=390850 RepID=A0A6V7UB69_MELEN|nr:unnamed protein product [Meloidogyne enterolobii]